MRSTELLYNVIWSGEGARNTDIFALYNMWTAPKHVAIRMWNTKDQKQQKSDI